MATVSDFEGEKPAARVERQARPRMVVAAVGRSGEFLGALGDPFDRSAEPPRRPQHQHPFGVEKVLHAKAAADIGGGEPDALGRHVEHRAGKLLADRMDALAGQQQVERPGRLVPAPDRGARLDRRRHDPVVDELDLDDMGGLGERGANPFAVAALEPEAEIAGRLLPDGGRPRQQSRRRIDHGGERPIIDRDPLGRVTRRLAAFGDDQRHRIADMAHPPAGERKTWRHDQRIDGRDLGDARKRAQAVGSEIGPGRGDQHTGRAPCRRDVDPLDRGMRIGRTQHIGMRLARHHDVFDIAPAPGQKPRILKPAHRPPHHVTLPRCIPIQKISLYRCAVKRAQRDVTQNDAAQTQLAVRSQSQFELFLNSPARTPMPRNRPGDLYLDELSPIRSLPGTQETSFYPAVANLLNQIDNELRPRVCCLHHPVDARARADRFLAWRKANPGKPDAENPHARTGTSN